MHIRQTRRGGGAITTMRNTLAPFSMETYPSLIVWLYLSHCRLLKLTAASNAGIVYKNRYFRRIAGRLLLDHYLDDRLSLSHVSWRLCRRNKQYPLMNGTATHQWPIVYDASQRSYVQVVQKPFLTSHLVTPKDIATKRGEDLSGWQICI